MANYYGMTRTNYFRVTDPERMKALIDKVVTDSDSMELWTEQQDGETWFGFGGYGSIQGLSTTHDDSVDDDYDPEPDYDAFEESLREILHPDDAIIITEIGNEKLRYLTAYSIIITKKGSGSIDLSEHAVQKASEILANPNYQTRMQY